ncbi:uncharacterized protein LOC122548289 isoform X2 [Chiloscyllium plagiosum]|nr:uncharacterized protein LOC122548289 isoform X2 [Chiloscyllium plagiosum]
MTTSDLLFIVVYIILRRFQLYYYPPCFLQITPVCTVLYVLSRLSIDCSAWFTVAFSFDRFVAICFHEMKTKYCTGKTATRVLATICIFFCLKNIPNSFVYKPGKMVNNVPRYCYFRPGYFNDPRWTSFKYFQTFLTPLFPFIFILFINILTVRHIFEAIKVRKELRGQRKTENDPEIGYMLRNLSCCTNALIYVVTQKHFRDQLKYAVTYPVITIIQLVNKSNIRGSREQNEEST